jgi:glutamate/tyrosine decarboxylase-like PLP-dependent enzyme
LTTPSAIPMTDPARTDRVPQSATAGLSAWFAGPKAENGDWFASVIQRILSDYYAWRRNYFPEDGVVVDSAARHEGDEFRDRFDDRLVELMGRLKGDVPFYSPRYAAHMISEQTLPSIAGYFAAMLYNPNNVSADAAPVTVKLELEAARLIAAMLGHPADGWAHLTSGGTIANIESLWVARQVKYLPLAIADAARALGLPVAAHLATLSADQLLGLGPSRAFELYLRLYTESAAVLPDSEHAAAVESALQASRFCIAQQGAASVLKAVGSDPLLLVPESHHYCFEKAVDVLGLGRASLRTVRVDSHFRMQTDDLEAHLDAADRSGRHIIAVVAVIGTTEEGAVDPVDRILALRARREATGQSSFWLHADAAYGGYLRCLTVPARLGLGEPRTQVQLGGRFHDLPLELPEHSACDSLEVLGQCDSIVIDPHKFGYIPYPAGCVCFRSNLVKPIVRQVAPYIADHPAALQQERSSEAIGVYILEGSKPGAAAAGAWLSHTLIPLDTSAHGALVQQTIRNACELHAVLEFYPRLLAASGLPTPPVRAVCLCPPGSNIVCFAFAPAPGQRPRTLIELNALNRAIYRRFSTDSGDRVYDQSFFISRTSISPRQYSQDAIRRFLQRLGADDDHFAIEGVFVLRSVLMNPWYARSKLRGRYFVAELAEALYRGAAACLADQGDSTGALNPSR